MPPKILPSPQRRSILKMWHTPIGNRILTQTHSRMFLEGVSWILNGIYDSHADEFKADIYIFDSLAPSKKINMLHTVTTALLDPVPFCPPILTAAGEATVAAVFEAIRQLVTMEIEYSLVGEQHPNCITKLVFDALDCDDDGTSDYPRLPTGPFDTDADWVHCIDTLSDTILWDEDYDLLSLAEQREAIEHYISEKFIMKGDAENYFKQRVRDIGKYEIESKLDDLFLLMGRPTKGEDFLKLVNHGESRRIVF